MKPTVWSPLAVLLLSISIAVLVACAPVERIEPETPVTRQALPAQPPGLSKLELVQSPDGARLIPKGDIAPEKPTMQMAVLDEIREDSPVVKAATGHPQVREKLGLRYFFINAEPVKAKDRFCPATALRTPVSATTPSMTRVTYYSYTNTVPVIVCMHAQDFVSLAAIPKDYQPPEGDAEEVEAIRVARLDARIQDKVKELKAHVILTDPEWRLWWWNNEGHGHRVFYVTFSKQDTGDPEYYAVVDLTEETDPAKVLQAGAEPKR